MVSQLRVSEDRLMTFGTTIARYSSLMLAALSTGVLFGTKTSLGPSTRDFTAATYIEMQQATVRNLRPVMGTLLPGAAAGNVLVLALTAGERRSPAWALTAGGLAAQLTALALTGAVELPINAQVLTWSPEDPPPGWQELRDRWDRVHTGRTVAAVLGLACLAAATFQSDTKVGP